MNKNHYIILGLICLVLYILYRVGTRTNTFDISLGNGENGEDDLESATKQMQRGFNVINGKCSTQKFANTDISGRQCAGKVINETRILRLGDQGCDVLLLQQRLNGIENSKDILKPNGQFNCNTRQKLINVIGVQEIRLNDFQPDEQIGFNELQDGVFVQPYSYMDANNLKK